MKNVNECKIFQVCGVECEADNQTLCAWKRWALGEIDCLFNVSYRYNIDK